MLVVLFFTALRKFSARNKANLLPIGAPNTYGIPNCRFMYSAAANPVCEITRFALAFPAFNKSSFFAFIANTVFTLKPFSFSHCFMLLIAEFKPKSNGVAPKMLIPFGVFSAEYDTNFLTYSSNASDAPSI